MLLPCVCNVFFYCIMAVLNIFWLLVFVFVAILIVKAHGTFSFFVWMFSSNSPEYAVWRRQGAVSLQGFFFVLSAQSDNPLKLHAAPFRVVRNDDLHDLLNSKWKQTQLNRSATFPLPLAFHYLLFFSSPLAQRKSTTVPVSFYFTVAAVGFGLLSAQCWTGKHFFPWWVVASGCGEKKNMHVSATSWKSASLQNKLRVPSKSGVV